MPSTDRDISRDSAERRLMHQHSLSLDFGKAIVPMWDSSDPERAPPPLPLNPSSPSLASRPNTSVAIQSAHAALTERARENALFHNNPVKRIETSPERSLIKGATHKRMQSLQPGHVKDLSNYIEGALSPTKHCTTKAAHTSPHTRGPEGDDDVFTTTALDKETTRSATPTITPSTLKESSGMRSSMRRVQQSILGENAPPQSATMLALQSMPSRDVETPLANVTNGSTAMIRTPQTFDAISNQILSLTSIATSLQREMAQLNRRSKDNATDLISLKEATNARDEDIRKSLRELTCNLSKVGPNSPYALRSTDAYILDDKPHTPISARGLKAITMARMPSHSPSAFASSIDLGHAGAPSVSPDGTATIALLEKVLREMATKEGQDILLDRLSGLASEFSDHSETGRKLTELSELIKESSSNAIGGDSDGRAGPMVSRVESLLSHSAGGALASDEVLKLIKTIKDSVHQGGGLTAEVKALVRELRGEVLGMGRELGRKLDAAGNTQDNAGENDIQGGEQIARIVEESIEDIRQHLEEYIQQRHHQTEASLLSATSQNTDHVYETVKETISSLQSTHLSKEDIIDAVREAWENYKPDIELQHFGLGREEMLACLKEGIQEFIPANDGSTPGASREEVFTAVVEGLKHFQLSSPREASISSRNEILDAVRECLEEFEFPSAPAAEPLDNGMTRDDILHAVREGLELSTASAGNAVELSRGHVSSSTKEELVDAVKIGLDDLPAAVDGYGNQILEKVQEILDSMRVEFRAVSDEAKQNLAAHGSDTEQVLHATNDGFDKLRIDIESYIDRLSGDAEKEDTARLLRDGLDDLRAEIHSTILKDSEMSVDTIRVELQSVRQAMETSLVPSAASADLEQILAVLRDGIDAIRADLVLPKDGTNSVASGNEDILDALQDGFHALQSELEKSGSKPLDMTLNYEILDTLKIGIESLRADIDRLKDSAIGEHVDSNIPAITSGAVIAADTLKRNDIEHLEVLITQLQIKVEAMESMGPSATVMPEGIALKQDIVHMEETLRTLQESMVAYSQGRPEELGIDAIRREDFEAVETLLRNTKAAIDDMDMEGIAKIEHVTALENVLLQTRDSVSDVLSNTADGAKHEDVVMVENQLKDIIVMLQDIKDTSVHDADTDTILAAVKDSLDGIISGKLPAVASKEDIAAVNDLIKDVKDSHTMSSEDRQAEIVGVGERVGEVKTLLEEFRDAVKGKIEEGSSSIESMCSLLDGLGPVISSNATVTQDVKNLFEAMKAEFENSNAGVVGVKLDADEKFTKTWEKIEEKFDVLMLKYDDAQAAAEAQAKAGEDKIEETGSAIAEMKLLGEELKLLIDTLGPALTDSVERIDESSKTVFNRVDDTFTKLEETHNDAKEDHQLTRNEVTKGLTLIEAVQANIEEFQPKILDSLKDVLTIVGQHFEHSRISTEAIQEKIAQQEEASLTSVKGLLKDVPIEKYDDIKVQEKLDRLAEKVDVASSSPAQLDLLERIQEKTVETAAVLAELVTLKRQRVTQSHDDHNQEIRGAALSLERSRVEKEHAEREVATLREEQARLMKSVSSLQADQDELAQQKLRLTADVSSLETALRIRREELQVMEIRAEGLERRIMEGVIDHSRAFLLGKTSRPREAMNLKRVPSHNHSTLTGSTLTANSTKSRGMGLAMLAPRAKNATPTTDGKSSGRRNFSLNQITGNVPTGGFKRSHSVKEPNGSGALRKSSWGGNLPQRDYGELNKENLALKESDEESDGGLSDTGTLRRTSQGAFSAMTGTELSQNSIDEASEYTETESGYSEYDVESSVDGRGMVLFENA